MTTGAFAIALDYGGDVPLCHRPERAAVVADILTRPCFATHLRRVCARRTDRWVEHARLERDSITKILLDVRNEAASFDSGKGGDLEASAEIQCGPTIRPKGPPATRYAAYVVVPYVAEHLEAVVGSVCDLAAALDAAAGFMALEPDHGRAHRVAGGGALPKPRVGLSDQRRRERRARHRKDELLDQQIANVEWATLLGPAHLERVTVEELRSSGAFSRVIEVVPERVALLQVTEDPMDDLNDGLEEKLIAARAVLASMMIDIGDVSLG